MFSTIAHVLKMIQRRNKTKTKNEKKQQLWDMSPKKELLIGKKDLLINSIATDNIIPLPVTRDLIT